MKRFGIALGIIALIILVIFFMSTSAVRQTSYFQEDYYHKTVARIDSIRSGMVSDVDSVQAGFARVSITPGLKNPVDNALEGKFIEVPLAGFGARKGAPATGIHDSIFIKTVALKINRQTIVVIGADLLIMPPAITDSVTSLLADKGIGREQLFFSATHTHSSLGGWGGGVIGELFAGKENQNIEKWLVLQISGAITSAIADLRPARIGSGSFKAGSYTRNRLIGESGTKNDDFNFITIEQTGGKKAVIGSFSAHSTTIGSSNMEISADYPGCWQRKIEETPVDYALFVAGSVGSQSPVGKGEGFGKPEFIGEALADSLNAYLPKVTLTDKVAFSASTLKMHLPGYHIRLTSKINVATWLSRILMPLPENVYLQTLRIGDTIWITTPSDFSGEYALQIKNALAVKGFTANISGFNGSYVGYIIPGRYFYFDEYEPRMMGWFGPNMGEYTVDMIRRMTDIVTEAEKIKLSGL